MNFQDLIEKVVDEELAWTENDHKEKLLKSLLIQAYRLTDPDEFLTYVQDHHRGLLVGIGDRRLANM